MTISKLPFSRRRRRRMLALPAAAAAVLATVGAWPTWAGDVPAARAADTGDFRIARDVPYRGAHAPTLDVYQPAPAASRAPAVMVVHGGAWRSGSKRRMSATARALARHGFAVFNVDYRLATPERPAVRRQQEDLRDALRWIRANAPRLSVDPRRIGALGSSAGGHLVSLLAARGSGPLTQGARLRAGVTWSAPFDLNPFRPGWLGGAIERLLGCGLSECEARRTTASPIGHVSPDDPPMLIVNSSDEVIPGAQPRAMADRLAASGVRHRLRIRDGSLHGVEYARAALPATIAFFERTLRSRRSP